MEKVPSISVKIEKESRNLKNINTEQFKTELKTKLENIKENVNIEEIYRNYINTITYIIERHGPTSRRKCTKKQHKSWFNEEALKLRIQRRRAEKIWQGSKRELHKRQYLLVDKYCKRHLYRTKKKTLRDKLNSGNNKTKTLYKITISLTSDVSENTLPATTSHKELADIFANFLVNKVTKIRSEFQHEENYNIQTRNCKTLLKFQTITEELFKTIKKWKVLLAQMIHATQNSFLISPNC